MEYCIERVLQYWHSRKMGIGANHVQHCEKISLNLSAGGG